MTIRVLTTLVICVVGVTLVGCGDRDRDDARAAGTPAVSLTGTVSPTTPEPATPTATPTPTPRPTPQPLAGPAFVVNSLPVGCHTEPDADAPIAVQLPAGAVQSMDALIRLAGETWHREHEHQCWTRTEPGPIGTFPSRADAERYAATFRPTPAPTAAPQPAVAPAATPTVTLAPQTVADPFQFCALVGTADWPVEDHRGTVRYVGPAQPFPGQVFRCWAGKVLGCITGGTAGQCMKLVHNDVAGPALISYCRENPSSGSLPGYVRGHGPLVYEWGCRGGVPVIVSRNDASDIDALGYAIGPWQELRPGAAAVQPTPPPARPPSAATPIPAPPVPAPPAGGRSQGVEWVTVITAADTGSTLVIERSNGEYWLLDYGVGCLSVAFMEGRRVLISSPGLFAGIGSQIILPDGRGSCRIWDSKLVR
jgi:hypothetical protein